MGIGISAPGALSDVVVLDLSRVLAGPFCTMMLSDLGAQVIKVELPGTGDDSRAFPPFVDGESVYFKNLNRNKKGITLNLKSEKGREIFLRLVEKADILIENYRPGTMEKLNLGWDVLKTVNSALVYGCVSGFGHTGPYAGRAGYDIVGQAMSGLMSVTGWPDGSPTRCGGPMSDVMSGISLCGGVLAALHYSRSTGIGQKVDIALVDTLVASMQIINQIFLATGRVPGRTGNRYESTYPYDTFPTKDHEEIVIGCANDKFWRILCEFMGRPDLIDDPDMSTNQSRVQNHARVRAVVEEWTRTQNSQELADKLLAKGLPACPIYNIAQITQDPQIAGSRQMFIEEEHPRIGKLKVTNTHIKLSETEAGFRTPPPDLGQHNHEIYCDLLRMAPAELKRLEEERIV
ncbi:MAG: CoA transferase [Oscillospiraceae bacterium]|jgi:formyl-CoA transferase|nr:CoA transferase [Oscillospiraceae bacterium]